MSDVGVKGTGLDKAIVLVELHRAVDAVHCQRHAHTAVLARHFHDLVAQRLADAMAVHLRHNVQAFELAACPVSCDPARCKARIRAVHARDVNWLEPAAEADI